MKVRQDHDIFGTKNAPIAARIINDSYTDPNEVFRRKMDQNYDNFRSTVKFVHRNSQNQFTKVNQEAIFEEDYHKHRKDKDMTSSIFYQQQPYHRNQICDRIVPKTVVPKSCQQTQEEPNHGRKETFSREIQALEINKSQIKGNSSRLFDIQERIPIEGDNGGKISDLIPYRMQWDQHDSIRCNMRTHNLEGSALLSHSTDTLSMMESNVMEPKAELDLKSNQNYNILNMKKKKQGSEEKIIKCQEITEKQTKKNPQKINQTNQVQKQTKVSGGEEAKKESVEVQVLKGWNMKYFEGLSKHCKVNSTPITKLQVGEGGRCLLILKRTAKWQNVVDWLRKDAKLKLRVMNP